MRRLFKCERDETAESMLGAHHLGVIGMALSAQLLERLHELTELSLGHEHLGGGGEGGGEGSEEGSKNMPVIYTKTR